MGKGRKARTYNIKWNDSDEAEIKRVVKNYNAKINRLAKKNPEIKDILPVKRDWKEVKNLVATRNDLKKELNMLERFSKNRNSADVFIILEDGRTVKEEVYKKNPENYNVLKHKRENPTKILRWEKNEINRAVPIINKKRAEMKKQIENIEVIYKGQGMNYKVGDVGMGNNLLNALEPLTGIYGGMERKDIKGKIETVRLHSKSDFYDTRNLRLKNNYIQGLKDHYSMNDVEDVINRINELDDDAFLKIFYSEKNASMEIASPKRKTKHIEEENVTRLRNAWLGEEITG